MNAIGLIEVNKVTTSYKTKTTTGGPVVNPHDSQEIRDGETKVQVEVIRIDEIKSFRPWGKSQEQELIEGDFTLIYFKEDPLHISKDKNKDPKKKDHKTMPTMLINENYRELAKRLGAIQLPQDEEA